jgi:membrane-associated phospholipid phosphatase
VAVLVLLWAERHPPLPPVLTIALDWHPIALFPLLYKEVQLLAAHVGDWRLTDVIRVAEAELFRGQPSVYLSERIPWVPVSEYLHFCYLAYLVVIPGVGAYWYTTGRRLAFRDLVLPLATVMYASYLFFINWPVDSPYYLLDRLGPPLAGHTFIDLVQEVSSRGGARGGAFPSAHASGATVLWLIVWHHQRRLAIVLSPLIGGLLVSTVFGRFHYALDVVAGVTLGWLVVWVYRRVV